MLRRNRTLLSGGAVLLVGALAGSAVAVADDHDEIHISGRGTSGVTVDGDSLSVETSYRGLVVEQNDGRGGETVTPAEEVDWEPPACYYAPKWTPSEFEEYWEGDWEDRLQHLDEADAEAIRENRSDEYGADSPHDDYRLDQEGEGAWWGSFVNTEAAGGHLEIHACHTERPFWVEHGEIPDRAEVPNSETLAELAYAHVDVPQAEVRLNPEAGAQKVNLDTWVWLDSDALSPVSATARLDGVENVWSTVMAVPVGLELDPGTGDAEVLHGAEGCPVGEDGGVGEPYAEGRADDTPPCGVTYLRATHGGGPYTLTATLTWEISWEGSDGAGGDLPDGRFDTTQEITVEEVQAIVRSR